MSRRAEALLRAARTAEHYARWARAAAASPPGAFSEGIEAQDRANLVEALETVRVILAGPDGEVTE